MLTRILTAALAALLVVASTGTPKIRVTVRNRGDGTAYFSNIELRLKQGGTIIEAARGTFPTLAPGEQARETVWLHEAETHRAYDTIDCRLRWLNARDRGFSATC